MVASTDTKVSKSAFVTTFLGKNKTANSRAVNDAWQSAGHGGTISPALVNKLRSELGLAGNLRASSVGRKATKPKAVKAKPARKATAKTAPVAANNDKPSAAEKPIRGVQVLAQVEADLDRLIYTLMSVKGLEKAQEALRSVRRAVVRSHNG